MTLASRSGTYKSLLGFLACRSCSLWFMNLLWPMACLSDTILDYTIGYSSILFILVQPSVSQSRYARAEWRGRNDECVTFLSGLDHE